MSDLLDMDWNSHQVRTFESDWEKHHGRLEQHRCWVIDVTVPMWDDYMKLPV